MNTLAFKKILLSFCNKEQIKSWKEGRILSFPKKATLYIPYSNYVHVNQIALNQKKLSLIL